MKPSILNSQLGGRNVDFVPPVTRSRVVIINFDTSVRDTDVTALAIKAPWDNLHRITLFLSPYYNEVVYSTLCTCFDAFAGVGWNLPSQFKSEDARPKVI
jgi:hypothetical protein